MKIVLFVHSLVSDWNHGNAHFIRGVVRDLKRRGHDVRVFEPEDGWSRTNLLENEGTSALEDFRATFPDLSSEIYRKADLELEAVLAGADLVLVHEWNDPDLVARIGVHASRRSELVALFHDTHHRMATSPTQMDRFELTGYDGVLAFGRVVRDAYLASRRTSRAWVWHEAADTTVFYPRELPRDEDLVWVGNWGDDERTAELREYLLGPVSTLALGGSVYGVRYPKGSLAELAAAGLTFKGWIANHRVPDVFSGARVTVHIPRRAYRRKLPGIPTIRVFEALACGVPLVCAAWQDSEGLFDPGQDFLMARDGEEMTLHLKHVVNEPAFAAALASRGRATIEARHTCSHRVDELLQIYEEIAS